MLPPRLAALLSVAFLDLVTEVNLQALADAQVAEGQDLEFKQARYDYGPAGAVELAKDVAALANQVGGLLIIGVAQDEQGRAAGLTPVTLNDAEKGRIRQVLADRIHPMIANVDVRDIARNSSGTGYYLILVPRSVQAPHAVRHKDQPYLCYPVRDGTTTRYLAEAEIAARYRDRFAPARDQVSRLERLHVDGPRGEDPEVLATAVALVPGIAGSRPLTGSGPKVSDFLSTWESPYGEFAGRTLGNVSVARRRLRCENTYLRLELHTDGAGWARYLIGSNVPGRGVLVVQLEQLEAYITEMLTLLGTYSSWAGAAGDCAISARTYGKVLGEVALRSGLGGRVTRQQAWPHEPSETTAALDQLASSRQQAGIVAYPLARDLEQDMGIPEPVSLQPDGTLIPI